MSDSVIGNKRVRGISTIGTDGVTASASSVSPPSSFAPPSSSIPISPSFTDEVSKGKSKLAQPRPPISMVRIKSFQSTPTIKSPPPPPSPLAPNSSTASECSTLADGGVQVDIGGGDKKSSRSTLISFSTVNTSTNVTVQFSPPSQSTAPSGSSYSSPDLENQLLGTSLTSGTSVSSSSTTTTSSFSTSSLLYTSSARNSLSGLPKPIGLSSPTSPSLASLSYSCASSHQSAASLLRPSGGSGGAGGNITPITQLSVVSNFPVSQDRQTRYANLLATTLTGMTDTGTIEAVCTAIAKAALKDSDPSQVVKALYYHLKDEKNVVLKRKVVDGYITPERLVAMTEAELMNPDDRKRAEAESARRFQDRDQEELKKSSSTSSQMFECGRCKQKDSTWYEKQTRSADEPMTIFISCNKCGNKWKLN